MSMTDVTVAPLAPAPKKASSLPQHVPMVVAVFVCGSFGYAIWELASHEVPAGNKELLDTLLGVLGTAFVAVVMYYFGSTKNSTAKDETISKLAQ